MRDQRTLWVSNHNQQIKGGGFDPLRVVLPKQGETVREAWERRRLSGIYPRSIRAFSFDPYPFWFDFHHVATMWSDVFGADALKTKVFDGRSFWRNFTDLAGLPDELETAAGRQDNPSLQKWVIRSKSAFKRIVPLYIFGRLNPLRLRISQGDFLNDLGGGRLDLSADQKKRIFDSFAASNARLGAEFMGLDGSPFVSGGI